MHANQKKEIILDAMQELMAEKTAQNISVSDIAKHAGIGKGSIYYYFKSKEDILEAVIERWYSTAIEKAEELVRNPELDALTKMEIIFKTCRESSLVLSRQEAENFLELQQSALMHQQYIVIMIRNLAPILTDIIKQGNQEGSITCTSAEEVARIVMVVLTITLDEYLSGDAPEEKDKTLDVFSYMLETSFHIEKGRLSFLREK